MNYVSFYRKWRPQNFEEIVGQDYVVKTLKNAISKNRLSHSYVFCGPKGTGKTSTARILAKALNCIKGPTTQPCNRCDNCLSISNGSSVDVIEIDAASNRGINEIRELREKVKYLPSVLRKKVYIIDEVHMLTPEAFNALLKVLEEPPEHVLFIMATTEPHKVIPTIMSRCQRFDFSPIKIDKIKKRLKDISERENISISEPALNILSKYADGSLRDADGMLEQLALYGDNEIDVQDVTSLLGIIDTELLFEFVNILIERDLNQGFLFVDRLLKSNINLRVFVGEFLEHLYNLYVIKNLDNPWEILDTSLDYRDRYLTQSRQLASDDLKYLVDLFSDLYKQIKWSEGSKIVFKMAIIKAISTSATIERDLERKIEKLESELNLVKKEIEGIERVEKIERMVTGGLGNDTEFQATDFQDRNERERLESQERLGKREKVKSVRSFESKLKGRVEEAEEEKGGEGGEVKVVISGKVVKAKDKDIEDKHNESKKVVGEDEGVEIIYKNWDKICSRLKSKKISVHAMFVECKSCKMVDGVLCFYLDGNKKWHRDHLNKDNNLNLISTVVREITGNNYRIKFELESDKENDNKTKTNKSFKNFTGNDNSKEANLSEIDIFEYFEKKFEIKE